MNIFVLSLDPIEAVQLHADQHVGKMYLEAVQLLCNAHSLPFPKKSSEYEAWLLSGPIGRLGLGLLPYKPTHVNHPCAIWVRESLANYAWLLQWAIALGDEWEHRFGKRHGTDPAWEWCVKHLPKLPETPSTPFAQAMPEQYRGPDPVLAYRSYYAAEKQILRCKPATWTKRDVPAWFKAC